MASRRASVTAYAMSIARRMFKGAPLARWLAIDNDSHHTIQHELQSTTSKHATTSVHNKGHYSCSSYLLIHTNNFGSTPGDLTIHRESRHHTEGIDTTRRPSAALQPTVLQLTAKSISMCYGKARMSKCRHCGTTNNYEESINRYCRAGCGTLTPPFDIEYYWKDPRCPWCNPFDERQEELRREAQERRRREEMRRLEAAERRWRERQRRERSRH